MCDGRGRVSASARDTAINPALIRSTTPGWEDHQSEIVDRIVCAMPLLRRLVVLQEYDAIGRRSDKEKRIGIGRYLYMANLEAAHAQIREGLEES